MRFGRHWETGPTPWRGPEPAHADRGGDGYPVSPRRRGGGGMIFGSDDGGGQPGLIINGVRIPFQMEMQVSHGPPPDDLDDDWDENAPGMIHLPVEVQAMIPHDVLYPPTPAPALPGQADPAPHVGPTVWDPGVLPPPDTSGQRRRRPVTLRALRSLGLDETLGRQAGGRAGLPSLPSLVPPGDAPDGAAGTDDDPDEPVALARPSGAAGAGTTGRRALDAAFAGGPIAGLDRLLRQPGSRSRANGTGGTDIDGTGTAIQPASDRRAMDDADVGSTGGGAPTKAPDPPASPSRAVVVQPAHQEAPPPQGNPNALDPDKVVAVLQRGMREADQAPAGQPKHPAGAERAAG